MSDKTINLKVTNSFCVGLECLMLQTGTLYFLTYWECKHGLMDQKFLATPDRKTQTFDLSPFSLQKNLQTLFDR